MERTWIRPKVQFFFYREGGMKMLSGGRRWGGGGGNSLNFVCVLGGFEELVTEVKGRA